MRGFIAAVALALWTAPAHACPACDDRAVSDQSFDLVITLLFVGSVVLIARTLFRKWKKS